MRFDFKAYDFADTDAGADAIAVVDAQGPLTWGALLTATQAWEQDALRAGVTAGVPLVLSGHKEAAFLVAILGCLRLRVPFVPVDVINPPERIARIGELVRAGLRYDAQAGVFAPACASPAPLAEHGLAYIMFTSGSTGDPKGVQIGRESVTLFAGWIRDCLNLGPAPAFMDQMLFSFDFSLFNWVGALELGGTCVLCPRETIAQRDTFVQYLADTGINVWASTPSFVRQQLFNPDFEQARLPRLRVFMFGAESLTPTLAEALWRRFPTARIINSYGPTEATCSTTWVEIDSGLRAEAPNPFPIGRAKPYAEVFIENGEISIVGDHVMRGYLNRPEESDRARDDARATIDLFVAGLRAILDADPALRADALVSEVSVHLYDLKPDLNSYLSSSMPRAPAESLEAILASGRFSPGIAEELRKAVELDRNSADYAERLSRQSKLRDRVLQILNEHDLDALFFPHQQRLVVPIGARQVERNGALASVTGLPAIALPGGFSPPTAGAPLGVPVGVELLGRPWDEGRLIGLAYGIEQILSCRVAPASVPPLH